MSAEPEPAVLAQFLTYMSCNDLFKFVPTRARFEAEIAKLPTDWILRICGFLEYVRDYGGELGDDLQRHALDAFALEPLRKDLVTHYKNTGRFFLFEEQLLGMMRFAILRGAAEIPELISVEQRNAFFWALMLYGDLHAAENPVEGVEDAARLEMRQLAFVTQEVPGSVMARAYALWVDLPSRPELAASPYFVDMPAEFAHAADGHPVTDYIAVVNVLLAHGGDAVRDTIATSYPRWPFDAPARFGASARGRAYSHPALVRRQPCRDDSALRHDAANARVPRPRHAPVHASSAVRRGRWQIPRRQHAAARRRPVQPRVLAGVGAPQDTARRGGRGAERQVHAVLRSSVGDVAGRDMSPQGYSGRSPERYRVMRRDHGRSVS